MSRKSQKPPALKAADGTAPRKYREEYDTYHGKPQQVRERSARNKARAEEKKKHPDLPTDVEVDHIVAISNGGGNEPGNRQLLPRAENRRKGAKEGFQVRLMRPPEKTVLGELDTASALEFLRSYGLA